MQLVAGNRRAAGAFDTVDTRRVRRGSECVILTRNPMNVIFAAPILSENAMRVITAATRLDGVRLGVIAQDPAEKLSGPGVSVVSVVAQHWRVDDVLNVERQALQTIVDLIRVELG